MKRAIVMSVLAAGACFVANQARAQGSVYFCNYTGAGMTAPVTFSGPAFGGYTDGQTIGQPFTAELLASLDGTTYSSIATTGFLLPSGAPAVSGGGLFGSLSLQATVPGYSSGNVWFKVEVYNGSSYTDPTTTINGESGVVELNLLSTAANGVPPGDMFADNSAVVTPLTAFTVAAIPEPTTMAFGAMGLLSLLAMARRKKA